MTQKINIEPTPYYTGVKSLDNNNYRLTVRWNIYMQQWYLDIDGISDRSVKMHGIALLPGSELIGKFGYSQLGELYVYDNSDANENPNFDEVGSRFTLEYLPLT